MHVIWIKLLKFDEEIRKEAAVFIQIFFESKISRALTILNGKHLKSVEIKNSMCQRQAEDFKSNKRYLYPQES